MFISFPLVCRHPPWSLQEAQTTWKAFVRSCAACGTLCQTGRGPFCANYSNACGPFSPCRKVWYIPCYRVTVGHHFPIRARTDEDGFENVIEADAERFKYAQNRDNLMVPFRCDICHFRKIQKQNPDPLKYAKDALALSCIRRANLDSIWSREHSTVSQNASQAYTTEDLGEALGFDFVVPPMGPFFLEDTFGMKIACVTLLKSLAPGKLETRLSMPWQEG